MEQIYGLQKWLIDRIFKTKFVIHFYGCRRDVVAGREVYGMRRRTCEAYFRDRTKLEAFIKEARQKLFSPETDWVSTDVEYYEHRSRGLFNNGLEDLELAEQEFNQLVPDIVQIEVHKYMKEKEQVLFALMNNPKVARAIKEGPYVFLRKVFVNDNQEWYKGLKRSGSSSEDYWNTQIENVMHRYMKERQLKSALTARV